MSQLWGKLETRGGAAKDETSWAAFRLPLEYSSPTGHRGVASRPPSLYKAWDFVTWGSLVTVQWIKPIGLALSPF